MNSKYGFTLKEGPKMKIENFLGTKSWRLKENFRGIKMKSWYIYRDQKHI